MIVKDWMREAAEEIEQDCDLDPGAWEELRDVIAKHCPMKDGEAWMRVPRCETCKWWLGGADGHNETTDGRKTCVEPIISPAQMDELMTLPDFGCVRWEAK